MVDVIPVSDPNNSTMAQRVVQYQTVLQMSAQAPQIYDLPQLHRQMIEVLGVKNADKLVPTKDDAKPTDPISENMDALVGKPMKAFIYQDHEAHIATHTSFMQDPMMDADDRAKPAGKTDYGLATGTYRRAPRVRVSHENRREAGRAAPRSKRGAGQRIWRSNCHG